MKLRLERIECEPAYTMGRLFVDGTFECWVLEDPVREGKKIAGVTAIPAGTYPVVLDFSNRFQKIMPHVLNVPGFEGIRIHAGNTTSDTDGCLLVGVKRLGATVQRSRDAYRGLFGRLTRAIDAGETVELEIVHRGKDGA